MKQLQVFGEVYEAERITKDDDVITGFDALGHIIFQFNGIKNPDDFVLLNGAQYDQAAADSLALTAAIMGGNEMASEEVGRQINRALQFAAQNFTEDQAVEIADIYPPWEVGKEYPAMYIVKYSKKPDGKSRIFQVMQAHTSQADWEPSKVPALFKELGFTDAGVAVWVQPQGGHDAYKKGDVVMHNGQKWESTTKDNVWEPGVYGWVVTT